MGSSQIGCLHTIQENHSNPQKAGTNNSRKRMMRKNGFQHPATSVNKRHASQHPSSSTIYEKWRLMLTLLIYGLVLQWLLLLPIILATLVYSLCHRFVMFCVQNVTSIFSKPVSISSARKTVLINGCTQAVSLHLARLLYNAGHRVVACDFPLNWLNATRFSNTVDAYYTVPNPRRGAQDYSRAICDIAQKENVDVYIPVSRMEDLRFDYSTRSHLERQGCRVFILHPWSGNSLTSKNNNVEHEYVLDKLEAGSDDSGIVIHRSNSISSDETVECGDEDLLTDLTGFHSFLSSMEKFSSTSLICNGKCVAVSTCSNNPDSNFQMTENISEQIIRLTYVVLKQVGQDVQSGVLTFDLVISEEGRVFPIGCGPYVGPAFLNIANDVQLVSSLVEGKITPPEKPFQCVAKRMPFCLYPKILSCLKNPSMKQLKHLVKRVWNGNEAFFHPSDPLPFFTHYHLHIPFVMAFQIMRGKSWTEVDHLNGKFT